MADIIIIGAGVSGLSAGIFARLSGHRVTLIEKNSEAGGNLTGWNRGDCHIDNCIHWLTGTNKRSSYYKLWQTLGALGSTEIYRPESLYTVTLGRESISLYRDLDKLRGKMLFLSPRDSAQTESFISAVRCMQKIDGIGEGNILTEITKLPSLLKYYTLTASELAGRFTSPILRLFFSSFLTEDFGALGIIYVFASFTGKNADIPRGGSYLMAERIKDRFLSLGGELRLSSSVKSLSIKDKTVNSVILSSGEKMSADYVISTVDPAVLFGGICPLKMPKSLKKRYESKKLKRFSSFQTAFVTTAKRLSFSGELIFELPEKYRTRLSSKYIAVREFSHEESFSPEGTCIIQTTSFLDEVSSRAFLDLYSKRDAYERRKEYLAGLVNSALSEKLPELSGRLSYIDSWTPATYHRYTGSQIGSYMSFAFSSCYLPTTLSSRVRGAKNLLLATQWQRSPGGLPIAADLGRRAVKIIDAKEKKKNPVKSEKTRLLTQ